MPKNTSNHLSKEEQIKLGSFYTPKVLVDKVAEYIEIYKDKKKNIVIFDNAAGCGAFTDLIDKFDYRFADYDKEAYGFLCKTLNKNKIFCSNSLIDVGREKYNIPNDAFVIQVGNPPYNDTTSEFKKGKKGKSECDLNLLARDLGVSFLKSFNKLKSDVVCVLHPLSYLIKETNFKSLKEFRENYILKKGLIFSSSMFEGTGSIKFPILIALYERNSEGMTFDYIKEFEFSIIDSDDKFKLNSFETIDGYIDKYPPGKKKTKISSIGLYYYTIRDFNALRKNTSFMDKSINNSIVVEIENLYKYAYLYCLKTLFVPKNIWLYGNLSPLLKVDDLEKEKEIFVNYAINTNTVIGNLNLKIIEKIKKYYGLNCGDKFNKEKTEIQILNILNKLL